jgi:hypothetical protein
MAPTTADDNVKFLIACITCKEGDKVRDSTHSSMQRPQLTPPRSTFRRSLTSAKLSAKPPRKFSQVMVFTNTSNASPAPSATSASLRKHKKTKRRRRPQRRTAKEPLLQSPPRKPRLPRPRRLPRCPSQRPLQSPRRRAPLRPRSASLKRSRRRRKRPRTQSWRTRPKSLPSLATQRRRSRLEWRSSLHRYDINTILSPSRIATFLLENR